MKDLVLPDRCLLMAVVRGGEVIFPRGDVRLHPGDNVLAVADEQELPALKAALLG